MLGLPKYGPYIAASMDQCTVPRYTHVLLIALADATNSFMSHHFKWQSANYWSLLKSWFVEIFWVGRNIFPGIGKTSSPVFKACRSWWIMLLVLTQSPHSKLDSMYLEHRFWWVGVIWWVVTNMGGDHHGLQSFWVMRLPLIWQLPVQSNYSRIQYNILFVRDCLVRTLH